MMKGRYLFVIAITNALFLGCAREKEQMVQAPDPAKRGYTQEELRKTGRTDTGAALEQLDPAVQSSSR